MSHVYWPSLTMFFSDLKELYFFMQFNHLKVHTVEKLENLSEGPRVLGSGTWGH